jgi:hypothetical protein
MRCPYILWEGVIVSQNTQSALGFYMAEKLYAYS